MDVKKISGNQPLKFENPGKENADGKTNTRLKKLVRRFANPREALEKVKEGTGQNKNPVHHITAPVIQRRSPPKPLPKIPAAKSLNNQIKSARQDSKFRATSLIDIQAAGAPTTSAVSGTNKPVARSVFQPAKPADMMDYIAQCAAFKKLLPGKIQNIVMEINALTAAQSVSVQQINAFRALSTASGPREKWDAGKKALAIEFSIVWLSLPADQNGYRLNSRVSNWEGFINSFANALVK